jgi:hypothetical protein
MHVKRLEDEIRNDMRQAGVPEPTDNVQMKSEMLKNEKSRHLPDMIGIYFDEKPEAESILSDLSRKWEAVRPAITGRMPQQIIDSETAKRKAIMSILAKNSTREGTLERRIADAIVDLPFEVSSSKPGDFHHEEGMRRIKQNQLRMRQLFDECKGEIINNLRRESERTGVPVSAGDEIGRFNSIVRSVMGKMMGSLVIPEVEKEISDKGLSPWKKKAMMGMRVMRIVVAARRRASPQRGREAYEGSSGNAWCRSAAVARESSVY